jgi:chaperonin cofactor prefoldin
MNENILKVEKTNVNLKMDFDARDVIDILVSEQEQSIENIIKNLELDLKDLQNELTTNAKEIDAYIKAFVDKKYSSHVNSIDKMFNEMGLDALVRFEIIDSKDMVNKRPKLMSNPSAQLEDTDKIIFALVITNKAFDRNVVDSTISFFLESDYDDKLKNLNKKRETILETVNTIRNQIKGYQTQLSGTDRLVRRAKAAAVTKKAIGQSVDELLADFRQAYPQIELKKDKF